MTNTATFQNFFSDVWTEIEDIIDNESLSDREYIKMRILGMIQNKADVFGIERSVLGIPTENADIIFISRRSR